MNSRKLLIAGGLVVGVCALAAFQDGGGDGAGTGKPGGGDGGRLNLAGGGPVGWTLKNPNIVWTPDLVGINVSNPTAQLDVKGSARFRNNTSFNKNVTVKGKIVAQRTTGDMSVYLLNRDFYTHPSFVDPQIFGASGSTAFFLASNEGEGESAGFFGDGDVATIWSAGDGTGGIAQANVLILDEDRWSDDNNPYNGTALIAYLNNAGTWVASDINRKQNILPLVGATEALMHLSGYTYEFKLAPAEVAKGQQPVRVAGLIAQEVIEFLPEAVNVSEYGEYFMNYDQVVPLLVEALKDQVLLNEENQDRIADLEARLAALERGLAPRP